MRGPLLATGAAIAVLLAVAACSGGEESPSGTGSSASPGTCVPSPANVELKPSDADYIPVIASSDVAVGSNRLV
ncbi:MAG TPA: hypothetical protein VLS25_13385, partial [Dehalococcoidia bacterium]|nr:hypothetical protein [Dehalococcoidia bacterium]